MANKPLNLTGKRFGKLTVITRAENCSGNRAQWFCQCDCGKFKTTRSSQLLSGNIKSCGCLRSEKMSEIGKMPNRKTHGLSDSIIYSRWCDMIKRCFNKNNKSYKDYGARGITVCKRWLNFENFNNDMSKNFKPELTLERVNNEGNYSPDNCIWADRIVQNNNSRRNKNYYERYFS